MRLLKPVPLTLNNGPDRMTIKLMLKVFSVAALVLLVFVALGPANGNHARDLAGRSTTSSAISFSH